MKPDAKIIELARERDQYKTRMNLLIRENAGMVQAAHEAGVLKSHALQIAQMVGKARAENKVLRRYGKMLLDTCKEALCRVEELGIGDARLGGLLQAAIDDAENAENA